VQRLYSHALAGVRLGVLLGQSLGYRLHLGAGALHGDPGFHPGDHVDAGVIAPVLLAADLVLEAQERSEDVVALPGAVQGPGDHTDDREGLAAQRKRTAEDAGVAAETPLPETFAEHSHALGARLLVLGSEAPAQEWLLAEGREELRRDLTAVEALGLATRTGKDEVRPVGAHERLEDGVLVPHVLEVGHGEAHLRDLLGPFGEQDEAVGLGVGQGTEEDRVDDAEERRVRPDAEGECRDRHRHEARRLQQRPRAEPYVSPPVFHGDLHEIGQTSAPTPVGVRTSDSGKLP
jgi:hypothetical protein